MIVAAQQHETAESLAVPCVVTVTPSQSLSRVAAMMLEHRQSHIPVVQGDDLHGLLEEKVLVSIAALGCVDMDQLTAGEALAGPAATVAHDTPISAMVELLIEGELDAVVVRRRGGILGIVTVGAILKRMSEASGLSALRAAPAEVKGRILLQHERIRGLLDHLEEQSGRLANGEESAASSLEVAVRMLTPVLLAHLEAKEGRLLPVLRKADGALSARADDLEGEHERQRDLLRAIHYRISTLNVDAGVAVTALDLVRAVRDDMVFEESEYLQSISLPD